MKRIGRPPVARRRRHGSIEVLGTRGVSPGGVSGVPGTAARRRAAVVPGTQSVVHGTLSTLLFSTLRLAGPATLALAFLVGCASSSAGPDPGLETAALTWIRSPLEGWLGPTATDERLELQRAWRAFSDDGLPEVARSSAEALLRRNQGLTPAAVLLAQIDLVHGQSQLALERLRGLDLEGVPDYFAGQLALGRAADLENDVVVAYRAFRNAGERSSDAQSRAAGLEEAALTQVELAFEDALARDERERALDQFALLREWRPGSDRTLAAERLLASSSGDRQSELELLRQLAERTTLERGDLERRAELEVAVGEAHLGLDIYRQLVRQYPEDPDLPDRLAAATFRWRLENLPKYVQDVVAKPELERGDLATLFYWTVPSVRSAATGSGRIASDVLDHPRNREIVKVLNLGLMDLTDSTLNRFDPERKTNRGHLFAGLLRLDQRFGRGSCSADVPGTGAVTSSTACAAAVRCGLIEDREACMAGAPVAGEEALELVRKTLALP